MLNWWVRADWLKLPDLLCVAQATLGINSEVVAKAPGAFTRSFRRRCWGRDGPIVPIRRILLHAVVVKADEVSVRRECYCEICKTTLRTQQSAWSVIVRWGRWTKNFDKVCITSMVVNGMEKSQMLGIDKLLVQGYEAEGKNSPLAGGSVSDLYRCSDEKVVSFVLRQWVYKRVAGIPQWLFFDCPQNSCRGMCFDNNTSGFVGL